MKKHTSRWTVMAVSAVLLTSVTTASFAAKNFVSTEHAFETSSDAVVLPSGPGSTLVVTPCSGCAPVSLPVTARSTYLLRKTSVTLAEFKQALAGRAGIMMTVMRSTTSGELTRVIAALDPPASATSTPSATSAPARSKTTTPSRISR